MSKNQHRADRDTQHRSVADRNKRKIIKTQTVCALCGKPVDKSLKFPHPMSPTVDHIIPISRGGHPSDINNMQLAHLKCNREKADMLLKPTIRFSEDDLLISNRDLPQSRNWNSWRG